MRNVVTEKKLFCIYIFYFISVKVYFVSIINFKKKIVLAFFNIENVNKVNNNPGLAQLRTC